MCRKDPKILVDGCSGHIPNVITPCLESFTAFKQHNLHSQFKKGRPSNSGKGRHGLPGSSRFRTDALTRMELLDSQGQPNIGQVGLCFIHMGCLMNGWQLPRKGMHGDPAMAAATPSLEAYDHSFWRSGLIRLGRCAEGMSRSVEGRANMPGIATRITA